MSSRPENIEVTDELRADNGVRTFRAVDAEHNSPVIVKIFESPMLESTKARGNIQSRIKRWRGLRHPAILRPLHVESEGNKLLLVLPLIPTGSLEDRLVMGAVSSMDLGKLSGRVSQAVQILHEAGMAHGNLKPTNLLFDEDGGVVLTDLDLGLHGSRREQMGGTASSYRAPERLEGGMPKPKADQYSWALILLSMVTRRGPREALQELADIEDNPPSGGFRRQGGHTLSRRVAESFRRALSRDPAERFESISEFDQALQVAWGYKEAEAPRPAPAVMAKNRASMPARKRRRSGLRLVALFVLPLLCILGAVPAFSSGWAESLWHHFNANSSATAVQAGERTTQTAPTQQMARQESEPPEATEEAQESPMETPSQEDTSGDDAVEGESDDRGGSEGRPEPTEEESEAALPKPEATATPTPTQAPTDTPVPTEEPSPTPTPTETEEETIDPNSCKSDPNHARYCTPTPGS